MIVEFLFFGYLLSIGILIIWLLKKADKNNGRE